MSFNHHLSALVCDAISEAPPSTNHFDFFAPLRVFNCPSCVPGRSANGFRAERNARVQAAAMGWGELRDGNVVLDFCPGHVREDVPMRSGT